jgi:hypothetical protein
MKKPGHYLILTEAELTHLIAAAWASGKAGEFPFSLGDDGERVVLGAVIADLRKGYSTDFTARRDALRRVIGQAFTRGQGFRDDLQNMLRNPFTMLFSTGPQPSLTPDDMRGDREYPV